MSTFDERAHALMDRYEAAHSDQFELADVNLAVQITSRAIEQILIDKGIATGEEFQAMYLAVLEQIVVREESRP